MTADQFISFENITFSFSGNRLPTQRPVLEDVSLQIRRGEFFCLLGPSGCGKSTLLNVLAGFETPLSGSVAVGAKKITVPGIDRMMVFQGDDSLFPWLTALENIEFGLRMNGKSREERQRVAMDALRLVGLGGQGDKFPGQLSGGMKQRIQIARAIVLQSEVLLMDEPFAALDAQMRTLLQDELVQLWERTGSTILFVTHDIVEALILGDRIGLMTAGPRATIREIVAVDLSRPRRRGDPAIGDMYERLNKIVSDEVHRTLEQAEQ